MCRGIETKTVVLLKSRELIYRNVVCRVLLKGNLLSSQRVTDPLSSRMTLGCQGRTAATQIVWGSWDTHLLTVIQGKLDPGCAQEVARQTAKLFEFSSYFFCITDMSVQ